MKVTRIYDIHRNDCTMDTECEHCGHVEIDKYAYNDSYYIHTVVRTRFCPSCHKNSKGELKLLTTK